MKKTYLNPEVEVVSVEMDAQLLEASQATMDVFKDEDDVTNPADILSGDMLSIFK